MAEQQVQITNANSIQTYFAQLSGGMHVQLTSWLQGQAELTIFGASKRYRARMESTELNWHEAQRRQSELTAFSQALMMLIGGVAVIANRPFAEGALFGRVKDRTLPAETANHGCRSWAQVFLRWILAHPAVSCAIPASNKLAHLEDNMAAGIGPLPDLAEQKALARMAGF